MDQVRERIRTLNDELRRNLPNCHAVITCGIAALGPEAVARIVKTIAVYDDFCQANDPYGEHDFGSFEVDGADIFFKIDYFDKALAYHCRVEVPITRHLPHRSRRATFLHRALVEGQTRSWVWTPQIRRLAASVSC